MITCSLRVANLEDEPKFKALSYSWVKDGSWIKNTISFISNISIGRDHGKTMDSEEESQDLTTREILCNGRTMNVYQNLYDALLQLRKSCPGDYWIDAICINQGDLLERNQQVQIMDQIYGCAETVTVWLGVCPDVLASAMAKIEQKKGILPKSGYSKVLSQISEVMVTVPYLLSRRYFSRLWVLQEICLAKRLELFIGEHRISPQTLISLTEWSSDPTGSDAESTIPVMLASTSPEPPDQRSDLPLPITLFSMACLLIRASTQTNSSPKRQAIYGTRSAHPSPSTHSREAATRWNTDVGTMA